jgi:hypothetical protein
MLTVRMLASLCVKDPVTDEAVLGVAAHRPSQVHFALMLLLLLLLLLVFIQRIW